ncbi:MAG: hypothetical protein J7L88_02125 [Thermoplasmata archaeon]|nr:hypothetical protein [Thermoplasmata archaeon]
MDSEIRLSETEKRVLQSLKGKLVATPGEVAERVPEYSIRTVYNTLHTLSSKGLLLRVKNGLYVVKGVAREKPLRAALEIFDGYIAFSTALKLHKLLDERINRIYVATVDTSVVVNLGRYTVKAVPLRRRATGMTLINGLYTSTIPKTLFDCFLKPQYCGDYSAITRALYTARRVDWDEFLTYLRHFPSSPLYQRTGYVLELMGEELDFHVPDDVIEYLSERIERKTVFLLPGGRRGGMISEKWRVVDNVGRLRMFLWKDIYNQTESVLFF